MTKVYVSRPLAATSVGDSALLMASAGPVTGDTVSAAVTASGSPPPVTATLFTTRASAPSGAKAVGSAS